MDKIFSDLKVIELHHEKLSDLHKRLYASTLVSMSIYELLNIPKGNLLIEKRLVHKVFSKLASLMGRILALGLKNDKVLPHGHSVTIAYKKL